MARVVLSGQAEEAAALRVVRVSTDTVAAVVRQDPAMASKLLQFANSAFFARSREELADAAFMAGLLCDVGELVLASKAPERLASAWQGASERGVPRIATEREVFGVSHVEIGTYILNLWGLPFRVVEAVGQHHAPQQGAQSVLGLPVAIWIASNVASGEEPGCRVGRNAGRPPVVRACEALGAFRHTVVASGLTG